MTDAAPLHLRFERLALPRLELQRAQMALAAGDSAAAQTAIRSALAEARSQKAHKLELKALLALFEAGMSGTADTVDLRTACESRTEGRDTSLYRRAANLVAQTGLEAGPKRDRDETTSPAARRTLRPSRGDQ